MLTQKCIVCSKELIRSKNQNSFCSRKCFYKFQDKRIEKKCLSCDKIGKWKKRFCSQVCYWKWSKGKPNNSNTKFKKGSSPWNKDKKMDKEWYDKMRKAGFFNTKFGEYARNWKGDNAGYYAIHIHLVTEFGNPQECEHCGTKGEYLLLKNGKKRWSIQWANIDHKYSRKREDYIGLCRWCHEEFDKDKVL